ncbi:MAG: hypothetical protein NTU98_06605 [Bacteroidetes bacterium]|nr:hypothetical protein [Bacteroidota bacterium]
MRSIIFALFFLSAWHFSGAQATYDPGSLPGIGPSYRIHPGNVTQSEVFIVKSPVDTGTFFVACNAISFVPFFISEGIYISTDAGGTWKGHDSCSGEPVNFHGGDPGIAIDKNGTLILTRMGRAPFVGLFSHYSADDGATWSYQKTVSTDDLERASLASDVISTSIYNGRTYAAWTKLSQPFPLMFACTDDGAQTWSTQRQVNNPSSRCAGGDIVVGPDGKVYACWAAVTEISPFKEIAVGFASSSNGGASWNITENAFAVNGITGILPGKNNIRVNGLPNIAVDTNPGPRRGWIYIVTGQKDLSPAGSDPDIILYRSADGGTTWSSGIRVNQDPLNNGKTQYFPNIHIDRLGAVDVLFYDDRTTSGDSAGVFLARSFDGGNTWFEYEICDHHFRPVPIGGLGQGYQGDVIDMTSTGSKIWPVWMDNSSGIYQVWTAPIDFASVNGIANDIDPGCWMLDQNKPNPFTGKTVIPYHVHEKGKVILSVYDLMGNEIVRLVDDERLPGKYEAEFDPGQICGGTGGIWFYRLQTGNRTESRKMVWVR